MTVMCCHSVYRIYVKMVERRLSTYVRQNVCEMLLLPLNMKYVLVDLNPSGHFYDTVCTVQLLTGERLFSEYLLIFIVVIKDDFRINF